MDIWSLPGLAIAVLVLAGAAYVAQTWYLRHMFERKHSADVGDSHRHSQQEAALESALHDICRPSKAPRIDCFRLLVVNGHLTIYRVIVMPITEGFSQKMAFIVSTGEDETFEITAVEHPERDKIVCISRDHLRNTLREIFGKTPAYWYENGIESS